eukprot:gnl/MRDRNA2_/MRDRNA2_116347_c0_seq1.p1 gnl/MRDRNA2_/MRDRNA2_116347_c0~~gnl/MRDRNA2_/MRDRNA2_116347_c0_seq1.p1  ORF type:complete len:474 (-),score=73.36 gnl/MRDRNA2_/MRDRNA2_116347_c0_seq1:66-1487(-)
MRCKGRVKGSEQWHPVQIYFSTASNCDLMDDGFAEEVGLELKTLYGKYGTQPDWGFCQVSRNVSIQLQVGHGHYVTFDLPVMVVPEQTFCPYRKVILGLPFLKRNSANLCFGDDGHRLLLGRQQNVDVKLSTGRDTQIPTGINVTGYFCVSGTLNNICEGKEALTDEHIIDCPSQLNQKAALLLDGEFQNLLDSLVLSDIDFNELVEQRGFLTSQIEKIGFKTWPGGMMQVPFMQSCKQIGIKNINVHPALLIPSRTQDGLITAIHTKPHREDGSSKPKYMWASVNKSFKLYAFNLPGEPPNEPEDPLFICAANKSARDSVAIIEGGLKAYAFAAQLKARQADLHAWVIGAAGGQFWQSWDGLLHARAGMQPHVMVLYPDAGAVLNPDVLLAYFRSIQCLFEMEMEVAVAWWGQRSKEVHLDVDDFLIRGGHLHQIKQISVQAFWKKVPSPIRQSLLDGRHADVFEDVLSFEA